MREEMRRNAQRAIAFLACCASAALAITACSGDGGGGTPTAPAAPYVPPAPESTFQPVCSAVAPDGSFVCIVGMDPLPGTYDSPTAANIVSVRITGKTPPASAGKQYRAIWAGDVGDHGLATSWLFGFGVVDGEFSVTGRLDVLRWFAGEKHVKVCALLERSDTDGNRREPMMWSPWVGWDQPRP